MNFLILWIWLCAYLNCVGWLLSASQQLNAAGYAVALLIFAAASLVFWKTRGDWRRRNHNVRKFFRRLRRPFPLAFFVLSALAFLGGMLYAPTNYDALAYRIPRILHWLDAGQWHWVHTIFDRLNNRSCGIEWVSAPIIALGHTVRPLFVINFISFLFLPGLVFRIFRRLGVRPRVAWCWMWLAPTGYGFLLQAGSIGNDLFGAFFALAAVDLALRSKTGGFLVFVTSIVAAAMMTAAKTNNLPMLLPWAVALLPSRQWVWRRPLGTLLVAVVAVGASALPTIYFNWKMAGDWSGAGLSNRHVPHAVPCRTAANVVSLTGQNLVPPVFPEADEWNRIVKKHLPPGIVAKTEALIEEPGCWFSLPPMQIEECSGLGFGLTALLATSWLAVVWRKKRIFGPLAVSWPAAVRWASVLAFVALLTQSNISAIGRLFAAYYVLPMTVILTATGHDWLVRKRWWQGLAGLVFAMAAALLVLSPARPLFPRAVLLAGLSQRQPLPPKLNHVYTVYSVYRDRPAAFAPVLASLPSDLPVLGLIGYDTPETSLWQPFGARRIVHICPGDTLATLKGQGLSYILINGGQFENLFRLPLSQWLQAMNAIELQTNRMQIFASKPVQDWRLVQLR